jgi:uncharacterized protein YndB with AHSA1/START domain
MTDRDSTPHVRIERVVDAPVQLVWQLWTDPDSFCEWYGPSGATIAVIAMDVRVGGRRHICMSVDTPNGKMQMWFTGEHLVVVENELLVYSESMSDEHGNVLPASALGMPHDHPTTTTVTVELAPTDDGTKIVMTHAGIPDGSPGAMGWNMAFDKLDAYVGPSRPDRA